jgi:hypothetical protein
MNKNTRCVKQTMKTNFFYVNICKHEHEKNMTMLWCKIMSKINVEQIEENERFYFYLYPLGNLTQGILAFKNFNQVRVHLYKK